ncbi:pullulanase, type I [Streptococcus intermedius]|uniref:Pullulanase, type I n=1 Tax=Streptococcus intermedius TaxID=1338 RepID=A0AAD1FKH6_STRIT|nr:type I pullulanase [Streptococcus intermedius]BAW17910.1 pullulanase, type I [Streptococcus intermedius]
MAFRTFQAYLDDQSLITIELEKQFYTEQLQFTIEAVDSTQTLQIRTLEEQDDFVQYSLAPLTPLDVTKHYWIYDHDRNKTFLQFRHIVRKPIFDQTFAYTKNDLGAHYTPEATAFKLWAPISEQVLLHLQNSVYPMTLGEKGVWQTEVSGNFDGAAYYYLHKVNGHWVEVHDPYALSSESNSGASYVINLEKISRPIHRAQTQMSMTEAIIYEMSVRDFSMQKEAKFTYPGKFKSLTESPQLQKHTLGMEYIKQLGVTHIQLMPLYDFGSVDENHPELVYNWGYDPMQYNLPDGSFATNPHDPYARIVELQEIIATYHQADISVIMDVVYNHVYDPKAYAFEKIVPGYFFRYDHNGNLTNGTFCGNDVASERAMVRSYIKHSLKQWLTIYGFDGFRFDLMGILDIETMKQIAEELQSLYLNVYLYGEGWRMNTGLDNNRLAHQFNADKLPSYGFFNDHFRNTIKATIAEGKQLQEKHSISSIENILTANVGVTGTKHFIAPHQAINYVECHDDATAFDYFAIQNSKIDLKEQLDNARLALHLSILAQGVPFIHSGQEFFRSKNLIENTYNTPDTINRLDWLHSIEYEKDVAFIRQLIQFRKKHPLLRLKTRTEIKNCCSAQWLNESIVEYKIKEKENQITILINFGNNSFIYPNQDKQAVFINYPKISLDTPLDANKDYYTVPGKQVLVLK